MKTAIAYCRALELTGGPGQHARNLGEDEKGVSLVYTLGGPHGEARRPRLEAVLPAWNY